jgi:hypothetical protein
VGLKYAAVFFLFPPGVQIIAINMLALESLRETILSNAPTKDVVGVFLALNLCAYLVVYVSKRWTGLCGKTARASSPDVEKPASGIRGKVTRPPGGKVNRITQEKPQLIHV